jgi:hypothetical protein
MVRAADASGEAEPQREDAVGAGASEHSLRSTRGPAWDGPPDMPPALAQLANTLSAALSPADRLLVTWLGHHVPQQQIALWLGITYDATSKRVRRLRTRMHRLALTIMQQANPDDAMAMRRFLERAGALDSSTASSARTENSVDVRRSAPSHGSAS